MLTVTSGTLTATATTGPLQWAGGSIKYVGTATSVPSATVSYTATLTGPGIAIAGVVLASANSQVIAKGDTLTIPAPASYGTPPMAAGTYTVTLIATITAGSKPVTSVVTVPITTGATNVAVTTPKANEYVVTVTFTGNAPVTATGASSNIHMIGGGNWVVGGGTGDKAATLSVTNNVLTAVFPAWKKTGNGTTFTVTLDVPGYPQFTSGPTAL